MFQEEGRAIGLKRSSSHVDVSDVDGGEGTVPIDLPSPEGGGNMPRWSSLPVELLIRYYDEMRVHLPPLALKEMNLEEELLLQYHSVRGLQNKVVTDGADTTPLNQLAQVANTVSSTLGKLVDMQNSLYTSERHKAIENLMIRTLCSLPEEKAEEFLLEYRRVLETFAK